MSKQKKPIASGLRWQLSLTLLALLSVRSGMILQDRMDDAPVAIVITNSSASSQPRIEPPANCGNGIVESNLGEECDNKELNGLAPGCTRWCKIASCGDGIVQPKEEECEPPVNPNGGFYPPVCGKACTVPTCDSEGFCQGGCRWVFLDACKAASSSKPTSSAARSSLAPQSPSSIIPPFQLPFFKSRSSIPRSSSSAISIAPVIRSSSSSSQSSSMPPMSSGPIAICGNGWIELLEECDDGNTDDTDTCTSKCLLSRCGDGIRQQTEECEDGNLFNNDACTNACRFPACGDAIVQNREQCDDGNGIDIDGCSNACVRSICGDGVVQGAEECDDGNTILGDGCAPTCRKSLCGNALLEQGEECDQGDRNSDTLPNVCSSVCLMPRCGDNVIDDAFGEQCDDGGRNSDTEADSCRTSCIEPRCGDGTKDTGEDCDDGNGKDDDACLSTCRLPLCGNAVLEGSEQCDDGNALNGDGCTSICMRESKFRSLLYRIYGIFESALSE